LNKRYDDPRVVLERIGCEIVEMPRNRSNSFCCGAGGGRIWMADPPGKKKPADLRVEEAVTLGRIDVFVTCCPKDLTMFEDARKTAGLERAFVVEDIAELVARAVELGTLQMHDVPQLVERISGTVVERISARLEERLSALAEIRASAPPGTVPETAPALRDSPVAADKMAAAADAPPVWRARPVRPAVFPSYVAPPRTGRRILVPVKHVAKLSDDFCIDSAARVIPAEYFDYQLNEFDDMALEQALKTAETFPEAEVVVVTVGPPAAEDTLRKALAKGAHRGVRIWADDIAFSDPLAIARLLAGVATAERPDLVFCGVQSSDQANGATGAALARLLNFACAAVAVATEWDGGGSMRVTRELEGGLRHEVRVRLPAVVTVQAGANVPRYATMRMLKQAKTKPIVDVDAAAESNGFAAGRLAALNLPSARRATILTGSPTETAAQVIAFVRAKMGDAR
jgi:electron transfer flavoprotein alpha/beta subunit